MKNVLKTQSILAKFAVAAGFFALGGTAIGGTALANQTTVAQASPEYVTYPVRFADLDISTMKGTKTLYLRIRFAAETLCQSAGTWGKKEADRCVGKAVDGAVASVNSPLLSHYYQLRSKHDKAGLVQLAKAN